ncbi:MAG: ABC transporter ATP-binding protein [Clostridiales bacterium]|nr:ABC transporter ATP-binding protein [Clostridiales bacterium]
MNTILKVNGLTKKYGSKTALNNVTFSVEKGRIYGFIGENGAGKTTAIRAITGLSETPEGKIELFGTGDKKGLIKARRKMGYLVENPIISMNDTAEGNLRMQQLLYGNKDETKIRKILERVGLADTGNKKAKDFSLGMRQRLGIALALVNDPEILILDEPVNGLDPMGMVAVRELLKSLCNEDGITIVISSHILAELYQLVTDYIIISHGEIIEQISKEELDRKCSSYIIIETEQTQRAIEVLEGCGLKDVELDGDKIKIHDNIEQKQVATIMFNASIILTQITRYEKSLEDHYIELLGRK